ncbi:CDF-like metal transporter [Fistulina hepatica ATCC 64428]|uniref:CDF-like metal transporter n=1 Tax=Fistulina hepatica ATCC 64428 TaxID=1128425 RepID=A0A0D7AFU8_9AGAR|nr:CDF-like metal transporter [Fistulina hepatica ATCC 64428]
MSTTTVTERSQTAMANTVVRVTSRGRSELSHRINSRDAENPSPPIPQDPLDPYYLKRGYKSKDDLIKLRELHPKNGKRIVDYQERQNELITSLLMPMEDHTQNALEQEKAARLPVRIAVWASLLANVVLSGLQLYAAVTSGSLSFLATALDSVFDPGSNLALFWLHKKSLKLDTSKWPVGGDRLETVGNIVYGEFRSLMASVNLVIIVESVTAIVNSDRQLKEFYIPAVVAVGVALGVKFLLFLYCLSIRKHSSQVQVLWEDHRNDLFINGFGLLMATGGSNWAWFLDPMGGFMIAVGVIVAWSITIYKEFGLLVGKSAPHEFIQLVIYKALTFSDDIVSVDTVRAYHNGPDYFVEVDIVMDPRTPLIRTHDVSQRLQDKIETLPGVGRAFVHVDHETDHRPEHRKQI